MSASLTRWNSTLLMILHMLEVRPHVSCYVCSTQSMLKQLSWIQGSRLYSPPTSWKLQTAIATGCKSLKFLPHCVCIIYIYIYICMCACVCDQEAFSTVSLLHRRWNQGARGARAPPKFDLSRSRVQLMLARVAVMESDSASETESVTEITPPKNLKQSTIIGLFGPQPASSTSTTDSESADTASAGYRTGEYYRSIIYWLDHNLQSC